MKNRLCMKDVILSNSAGEYNHPLAKQIISSTVERTLESCSRLGKFNDIKSISLEIHDNILKTTVHFDEIRTDPS